MSVVVRQVSDGPPLEFDVVVREGRSETRHAVTVDRDMLTRVAAGAAPDTFIRAVFAFLLEREPKESILGRFDVSIVRRYFPDFETKIGRYLDR